MENSGDINNMNNPPSSNTDIDNLSDAESDSISNSVNNIDSDSSDNSDNSNDDSDNSIGISHSVEESIVASYSESSVSSESTSSTDSSDSDQELNLSIDSINENQNESLETSASNTYSGSIESLNNSSTINIPIVECNIDDIIPSVNNTISVNYDVNQPNVYTYSITPNQSDITLESASHHTNDNTETISVSNTNASNHIISDLDGEPTTHNSTDMLNSDEDSDDELPQLSNNLHSTDLDFLTKLTKPSDENSDNMENNDTDISTTNYTDIKNIIAYSSYKTKIKSLINVLNVIKDDPIYTSCKYNIVYKLSTTFRSVDCPKYFLKNFLDYDMVDYLIKKKLFYDYVFMPLLIKESYIDYFDFKAHINHFAFYKNTCKKMLERLHFFIQHSNFYSFRLSDFNVCISFMHVVQDFINRLPLEKASELILECRELFVILIHELYNIIKSSRKTLRTIRYISKEFITKYIDKTGNIHVGNLEVEIQNCNKTINTFLKDDTFTNLLSESLVRFNILTDMTHPCYDDIIALLPSLTYKWYGNNPTIDNLTVKLYTENIQELLESDKLNIHTKVKFITESNVNIFHTPVIIKNLINYYVEIERFNENNGFYDKELTRSSIISCILEYIYPSNLASDLLYNSIDNQIYDIDEIDRKIEIFSIIDPDIMRSFVTLFISEITELFNDINISIEKFQKNTSKDIVVIYRYISSISQITIYYKLLTLLFRHYQKSEEINSIFIEKYTELTHTILINSLNSRIYCELPQFSKSNYGILNIASDLLHKMLYEFYNTFYIDLFHLSTNTMYLKYISINQQLYNRKCITDTDKLIGFIYVDELKLSISEIITQFLEATDKAVFEQAKTELRYDEELPFEFLDPIYYTPIITPIELPNTMNIVEKNVILNHLVFNQTNPFDGLKLTLKELLDYNRKPEVLERIDTFTIKYNKWKFEHVI